MTAPFVTSESQIFVADFRETLANVAALGGCDLVVTSPPYDDARTYGNAVAWTFADYQALGSGIFAALKPGGHCLMVLDGPVREWRAGKGTERSFTPWKVMLDWAERVGFRVPDRLAYARQGSPGRYEGRFRNDWEPLLWFQKPGAAGYFNKDVLSEKAAYVGGTMKSRKNDGSFLVRQASGQAAKLGLRRRGTLWNYGLTGAGGEEPGAADSDHPARYAVRFAEDAVRCFAPLGGLVCDPFSGSGTTAVATVRHRRRFVGGDKFADAAGKPWAQWGHERVQAELGKRAAALLASARRVPGVGGVGGPK